MKYEALFSTFTMIADNFYFPSNENKNMFLQAFLFAFLITSLIFGTQHNHKRANNYVFYLVRQPLIGWKLWLSEAHSTSYFCGVWCPTFLLFTSKPSDVNTWGKRKCRTFTTTSTFLLLFLLLLMHSMGTKVVSTLQDRSCCYRWFRSL